MKSIEYYEIEYQKFKNAPGFYLGYDCFQQEWYKITDLHLIGIIGAPGSGKTTFALNVACNIINQTNKLIKLYSLDKVGIFITDALKKIDRPEINKIDIEDKLLTVREIYDDFIKNADDYACVIIDFLYKIKLGDIAMNTKADRSIYETTNKQVQQIEAFQKTIKKPVIVLIQPNREAGDGSDFPSMIQGEGSAKIEQTFLLLLSLCRPEKNPKLSEMNYSRWHNIIKIKAVKNSFGISDVEYELYFEPNTLRISNK